MLRLAKDWPILYALDNLESLSPTEHEAVRGFLDDLPRPGKAILTTRVNRRIGKSLHIEGLSTPDGASLVLRRAGELGVTIEEPEIPLLEELVTYVGGLPLALLYAINSMAFGRKFPEVLEATKGGQFLKLLAFSFESSLTELTGSGRLLLVFLALSKASRTRKELLRFTKSEDELDELLAVLQDLSFIRNAKEDQNQKRFSIENEMLRDHVLERAPHILSGEEYERVMQESKARSAISRSVSIEVERALRNARQASFEDWSSAAKILEAARESWGEDPRILSKLGYYYFRLKRLDPARKLMEGAINRGFEDAETFAYLSIVLYYQKAWHEALQRADTALALRPRYPLAEQLAGECHLAIADQERLILDATTVENHLNDAIKHLTRSLINEERSQRDEQFNHRSQGLIDRAEANLERMAERGVSTVESASEA